MTISIIDTPDGQSGVVLPQKLIGNFASGVQLGTVTVPANATALWVICSSAISTNSLFVVGLSSNASYPAVPVPIQASNGKFVSYVIPTVEAVDNALQLLWATAPSSPWFVVADGTPRFSVAEVIGNASLPFAEDSLGQQFVVPAAPGTGSFDHPPSERLLIALAVGGSGASQPLILAPGTGKRIRLYWGQMAMISNSTTTWSEVDCGASRLLMTGVIPGVSTPAGPTDWFDFKDAGVPHAANTAVFYQGGANNGSAFVKLLYSVETI